MQRAFSTLEVLIAMMVIVIVLSAVVVMSFGNQALLVGSETSSEAVAKAQELLEEAQALARKDFNLVNATSSIEGIYTKEVEVRITNDDPSSPNYLTKEVKAVIMWTDEHLLKRTAALTTLISNFQTPVGNNTCSSVLEGDWMNPQIITSVNLAALAGDPANTYTIGDIDAYRGKLYVAVTKTPADPNKNNFFVLNILNPSNPTLLGSVDNDSTVTAGFNAVRIAEDPASSPVKTYAYLAGGDNQDYTTCRPVSSAACGELTIVDVTNPGNLSTRVNLMLASSTGSVSDNHVTGDQVNGESLYFKSGFLFLGLAATGPGNGPEFHLLDVRKPSDLFGASSHTIFPIGSFPAGVDDENVINAIGLRGVYTYLVSPSAAELRIVNFSDPATPTLAGTYNDASGNWGKSIYLVGDMVYLGRTTDGGSGDEFQVLDASDPTASPLPKLGGINIGSSVNGVIVRDKLAFLATNDSLKVLDVADPADIGAPITLALPQSGDPNERPSLDCEGNYLYVSSNDASGKGYIHVITSAP